MSDILLPTQSIFHKVLPSVIASSVVGIAIFLITTYAAMTMQANTAAVQDAEIKALKAQNNSIIRMEVELRYVREQANRIEQKFDTYLDQQRQRQRRSNER